MPKPRHDENSRCPNCNAPAVALLLGEPQGEWVCWCENGHVTIGLIGSRAKVVFNFRDVEVS
jgi:hypothetical protein